MPSLPQLKKIASFSFLLLLLEVEMLLFHY